MRLHSHLPLKFWGDCVTTATYLINRLPSSVLGNKTPYEVLYHKSPSYDNLRVFGCFVVVSNPTRTTDKFDSIGVPCVFLGYPNHQKGYKFYNLLNHTTFVSRDAIFYEHIFPYSSHSIQKFLSPLPTTLPCDFTTPISCDEDLSHDIPCVNHSAPTDTVPNYDPSSSTSNTTDASNSNPPLRRSNRTTNLPTKMKDYVLHHHPKANQVSQTPLLPDFKAFVSALIAQTILYHLRRL